MKIARSLPLVIAGALAALSAPAAVQAQNQQRVAVCDREGNLNTVRVFFNAPLLALGANFTFPVRIVAYR